MSLDLAFFPSSEPNSWFSSARLSLLDPDRIPFHIAIIPDGNGRWAKRQQSSTKDGHYEGANTLLDAVKAAKELNIKILTFYTFSTENWSRPVEEVIDLMNLIETFLQDHCEEMIFHGIKLDTIGDLSPLPQSVKSTLLQVKEATKNCACITLILAINYGGRNELCRAFRSLYKEAITHSLNPEQITETLISNHLDTHPWPDPDLLIRTSGEFRISNFLLWQISYAEMFIVPVLWPDFTPEYLLETLINYQGRERRHGGR